MVELLNQDTLDINAPSGDHGSTALHGTLPPAPPCSCSMCVLILH